MVKVWLELVTETQCYSRFSSFVGYLMAVEQVVNTTLIYYHFKVELSVLANN